MHSRPVAGRRHQTGQSRDQRRAFFGAEVAQQRLLLLVGEPVAGGEYLPGGGGEVDGVGADLAAAMLTCLGRTETERQAVGVAR